MREHRYASWRSALSSVVGIYLITDTLDGRQYVGKADGAESIRQRWSVYASNGHGSNVELRNIEPGSFRFSLLRVFDPATPTHLIDAAESHFKNALDTRGHGLNRNCRANIRDLIAAKGQAAFLPVAYRPSQRFDTDCDIDDSARSVGEDTNGSPLPLSEVFTNRGKPQIDSAHAKRECNPISLDASTVW